jgi:hypothetical protein
VDEHLDGVGRDGLAVGVRLRGLPALRVRKEELDDVGFALGDRGQRVVVTDMGANQHAEQATPGASFACGTGW